MSRPRQALILLGGRGQRLRPLTLSTPKPLLPIANLPFLAYPLKLLKKHGVREIIFSLSYRHADFQKQLRSLTLNGLRCKSVREENPLGTGGAIRHALSHVRGPLFVLNGDIFTDISLSEMFLFHQRKKAAATIATVYAEDPTQFGLVETSPGGRILRFLEKPSWEDATTHHINAGVYILEPSLIEQIPPHVSSSLERDVFPRLLKQSRPLYAYFSSDYWLDIGTFDKYLQAHNDLLGGRIPGFSAPRKLVSLGARAQIHPTAELKGFVSIGPGCRIQAGALLHDCVLLEGVLVGEKARLQSCVIGPGCSIGAYARVREGTILAARSLVKPYSVI